MDEVRELHVLGLVRGGGGGEGGGGVDGFGDLDIDIVGVLF